MDKPRRDNLRGVVSEARRLIEESVQRQLLRYGLSVVDPPLPRSELSIRPDEEPHYLRVLDVLQRQGRATGRDEVVASAAVARYVREAGGTWINRLGALRALESRGLLEPACAFVAEEYGGISPRGARLREQAAERGERISADEALKQGLIDGCRELSTSVRVLFDLSDEQSLFWPDHVALRSLLRLFSEGVDAKDWREPDILGWVYQYYNADANAELKKRKNRTTGFKYQADDIPIANQFYTPNWVVRALTDNTLGRLWLEMHGRIPSLTSSASTNGKTAPASQNAELHERRDGVPHAVQKDGEFRAWVAESPDALRDVTVDRLCRFLVPYPSQAASRSKKSVRDVRVIDPACGSGHFLLYAFDLLFAMYREEQPDLASTEIPALILERNLFGVDIDLRAAQLAAFGLYMKARATLHAIDPSASLRIRRLNIVVADAHIGSDPRRQRFLDRHEGDIRALYEKILSDLDHTNVLGSLLKVRSEFERLVRPWSQQSLASTGRRITVDQLLADLRSFEEEVLPGQDIGARLFFTDLHRTVGLLGLLSQRYDVVLMNPPYGDMPPEAKDYLKGNDSKRIPAHYPRTHSDYATAFLEQAIDLLNDDGFVGMLVTRSFMHLTSFEEVRTEILVQDARPEFILDLGRGILDRADVRVCAAAIRRAPGSDSSPVVFDRLAYYRDAQRPVRFLETLPDFVQRGPNGEIDWFVATLGSLRDVPGMPYAYWASDWLRALFRRYPPVDRDQRGVLFGGRPDVKIADVKQGLATGDDPRFVRFHWEVPTSRIGRGRRWAPFVKGGSQVHFLARTDLVVNWDDDGAEQRKFGKGRYQATNFYYRRGITWPRANWRIRRFGVFPEGCVFADKGPSVFPTKGGVEALLGILNSSLGTAAMLVQTPERMWEVGLVASVPVSEPAVVDADLALLVDSLVQLRLSRHNGDETFSGSTGPELRRLFLQSHESERSLDLRNLLATCAAAKQSLAAEEERLIRTLDESVFDLYDAPAEDRVLVERELRRRPAAEGGYSDGEGDETESETDGDSDEDSNDGEGDLQESSATEPRRLVASWLSSYVRKVIDSDEDGIVPLLATHNEPALIVRLRDAIDADLGVANRQALESQAPTYLGVESLEDWLGEASEETREIDGKNKKLPVGFFPWHVQLYRSRPIYWLVSSENYEKGKVRITFRAFVHFLKLKHGTLHRLSEYYLQPVLDLARRESTRSADDASRADGRKARQTAEKLAQEWVNTVAALERFEQAINSVLEGPALTDQVPSNAKWLRHTVGLVRGGRDVGHGYQPDIDLGVRANIAPLAEAKLLPRIALKRLGG